MSKDNAVSSQPVTEKILILIVQAYDVVYKYNGDASESKDSDIKANYNLVKGFENFIKLKNTNCDPDYLLSDLYHLIQEKTFMFLDDAEKLMENLKLVDIEVPVFVQRCYWEIIKRQEKIKAFIEKKGQWEQSEVDKWLNGLKQQLTTYSNKSERSKKEFIDNEFSKAVKEAECIKNSVKEKYDYPFDIFYNNGEFVGTVDSLNEFFWHSEGKTTGVNEFAKLFILLKHFIDEHNKISQLRRIVDNGYKIEYYSITILEELFDRTKPGYKICLQLFKELDIIDKNTGKCTIVGKPKKGAGLVFAIIDAFKLRTDNKNFFARANFNDNELLSAFNTYLGTRFKQIKRTSKTYKESLKSAASFIDNKN